jgi:hypothetical protein
MDKQLNLGIPLIVYYLKEIIHIVHLKNILTVKRPVIVVNLSYFISRTVSKCNGSYDLSLSKRAFSAGSPCSVKSTPRELDMIKLGPNGVNPMPN